MKKITLIIALVFSINYSFGAAILAGSLSMNGFGGSNYQTSIVLYNDCSGSSVPDSILVYYECITQDSLSFSQYILLDSTYEIVDYHDTSITSCNGGSSLGYTHSSYTEYVNLISYHDWKIYFSVSGRGNTNSCSSNASSGFYIESYLFLSNGVGMNSHPYNQDLITRVPNLFSFCLNNYLIDNEGDSLSFELISPMLDSITAITYNSPYDANNFMSSPVSFDSITGIICMTANTEFTGITKLQITEWRYVNGQIKKVGISQQDLLIHSYNVSNHSPVLSGMDFNNTTQYSPLDTIHYLECAVGDTVRFRIHAYDVDSGKNSNCCNADNIIITDLSSNTEFSTANISIVNNNSDSVYLEFLWVPTDNDVSLCSHNLKLEVADHWFFMLQSGLDTFDYQILVKPYNSVVSNNNDDINFDFYPNPVTDVLNIDFNKTCQELSLSIFDISGRLIFKENYFNSENLNLDLEFMPNGVYLLKLEIGDSEFNEKFIKE